MLQSKMFKTVIGALVGLLLLAFTLGIGAWGYLGWKLVPVVKDAQEVSARVNRATVPMLDCTYYDEKAKITRSNPNCLPSSFAATTGAIRAGAGELTLTLKDLRPKIGASADNSTKASAATLALLDNANGAVTDIRGMLIQFSGSIAELNAMIADIHKDTDALLKTGDKTLAAAIGPLAELERLEKTLNEEILLKNAPVIYKTLEQMLAIVQDENITKMIADAQKTTAHVASTAETIDIITLPLRKKVAMVKAILLRIAGIVKVAINPW